MTDLAVVLLTALLVCWASAASFGLLSRSTRGMALLRAGFGSARGALLVPPLLGVGTAATLWALHKQILVLRDPTAAFQSDADGCVHWLAHDGAYAPTLWAAAFSALGLCAALLPLLSARRARRIGTSLRQRIDRAATRGLRRAAGDPRRLFAARDLVEGPLVIAAARAAVFLPTWLRLPRRELSAVIAHERAHCARGHLRRRWRTEIALAVPLPCVLVAPLLRAARLEEECEADDEAVRACGSRVLVARALLRVSECVLSARAPWPAAIARFGDRDTLRQRIERLLAPGPRAPHAYRRALLALALVALVLPAAPLWAPAPALWVFCQLETLLGLWCC
jgi:Zn-dependent protease with chaperone function